MPCIAASAAFQADVAQLAVPDPDADIGVLEQRVEQRPIGSVACRQALLTGKKNDPRWPLRSKVARNGPFR